MDIYSQLLTAIETQYDTVCQLKRSERGSVHIVRHRASGQRFLLRRFEGDDAVYRRLLPLASANLPQVMEVARQGDNTVVLEEFVPGDTLAFVLQGGVLSVPQARDVLRQLCCAVAVLHGMGAVHRDIKPENVMLSGPRAVLLDMDASRFYKQEQPGDTHVLGTTGYAAPEQYGLAQSGPAADIYALGVLLNVMLTGQHPSTQLAAGRMGRIVQRCTRVNPKKRYKNILHLMEAL